MIDDQRVGDHRIGDVLGENRWLWPMPSRITLPPPNFTSFRRKSCKSFSTSTHRFVSARRNRSRTVGRTSRRKPGDRSSFVPPAFALWTGSAQLSRSPFPGIHIPSARPRNPPVQPCASGRSRTHRCAGSDIQAHAVGRLAVERQGVVGFEEMVARTDLDRPVGSVRQATSR